MVNRILSSTWRLRSLVRAAYPRRRSSNANGLRGQNSAGFPEICGAFQSDNLRRHFEFEQSGLCGVTSGLQIERGLPLELPDDVPQDPLLMLLRQHFCLMGAK
jgi:hypothetical protein